MTISRAVGYTAITTLMFAGGVNPAAGTAVLAILVLLHFNE